MRNGIFIGIVLLMSSLQINADQSRVGDTITLSGSANGAQITIKASYLSHSPDRMHQRIDTSINGTTVSLEDLFLTDDEVMTPESSGLLVAVCGEIGGVHEYLNLQVGRTLTCKLAGSALTQSPIPFHSELAKQSDSIWFGPFPVMGIAQISSQGTILTVQDYHWNN